MKKNRLSCGVRFVQHENLDVVRTSRDQEKLQPKGSAGESALDPYLSVVCPFPAQPSSQRRHRGRYRPRGSKYISVPQATNLIEGVAFAKSIDLPLVAHLATERGASIDLPVDFESTFPFQSRRGRGKASLFPYGVAIA